MTSGLNDIVVARADWSVRALIEAMLQFYAYDFSELEPASSEKLEPEPDGRFAAYPHIESYWRDDSRVPLIVRRDGRPVGFALIDATSRSGLAVDRNMAEFFVMRKHRRCGVASAAVREILTRNPGRWEIAIAERNSGARAFWPPAVAATPGVRTVARLEGNGVQWTGPILRFMVEV
jgi:predicted acetyltransferase